MQFRYITQQPIKIEHFPQSSITPIETTLKIPVVLTLTNQEISRQFRLALDQDQVPDAVKEAEIQTDPIHQRDDQ